MCIRSETLASGSKKGKVTIDYIREQKIFEVEMERKEDEDYGFILRGNKVESAWQISSTCKHFF